MLRLAVLLSRAAVHAWAHAGLCARSCACLAARCLDTSNIHLRNLEGEGLATEQVSKMQNDPKAASSRSSQNQLSGTQSLGAQSSSTQSSGTKGAGKLLSAYLFLGEDKLKREALLKRMQDRISELGELTLNQTVFEGPEIDPPDAVVAACTTMPFLSEKRLVVIKGIDHARKPVLDSICEYLKNPTETTVLVMIGDKLAKNAKIYNAVAKIDPKAIISCDLKTKKSEVRSFATRLASGFGVALSQRAAETLIERVGISTVAIDAEIGKLAEYVSSQGRTSIEEIDVEALVSKTELPKPWDVVDAMSSRNVSKCIRMLDELQGQQLFGLLTLCVRRIEELLTVKSLRARPGSVSVATVLGGPDWKYKKHAEYASHFKESELIRALSEAAECEKLMKTGFDQETSFVLWITGVCTGSWAGSVGKAVR